MQKDLPAVFSNPIEKEINNNTEYYYGSLNNNEVRSKDINKEINKIFASKDFVYKKRVRITMNDMVDEVILVGKKDYSLLTFDNKQIPISSILDIEVID